MANTQIVLLEPVDNLGKLGDVVSVKPGFARNFLLPQGKALRATKGNLAYFEAERKNLEVLADQKHDAAQKEAEKLEGLKLVLIRQASEAGQLYGSVTSRDIAEIASRNSGVNLSRGQVMLNTNIKTIGLFDIALSLYGDVKVSVNVNVARSEVEAKIQEKTGEALITNTRAEKEGDVKTASEEV